MNKLKKILEGAQYPLLNIYFTAGYPEKDITSELIESLDYHGADIIEIGMPYSDPMADGPTIQHSSAIALGNGMTVELLFEHVAQASSKVAAPLILMGYLNQMMQYGEKRFLEKCNESGIEGLIIPDLPPELFQEQYKKLFRKYEIEAIFLITPQTSEERIKIIDQLSDSFLYIVSDSSITGRVSDISEEQKAYFHRVSKMNLKNRTLIGFGISNHKSFVEASHYCSGAIIGSAFIKRLKAEFGKKTVDHIVRDFINEIKYNQ